MKHHNWLHTSIRFVVIIQFLLALVFPAGALAGANFTNPSPGQAGSSTQAIQPPINSAGAAPLAPTAPILEVTILSSPHLVVDSNGGAIQPRVFVVEARVTNTGDTTAEDVSLNLSYNNIPSGWVLVNGEDPSREVGSLAPGASYHGYWFATYPDTVGSSYNYSVTATASNIGGPVTANSTVTTVSVISAANSGITQVAFDVTVGVEFLVDIDYKLSNNAHTAHFSPVGNLDFDPSAYRLLSSTIYLYDANNVEVAIYPDRVYLADGEIPAGAVNATASFVFIALKAANTRLCSYAMIGYNSGYKYDINYCDAASGGVININGSISLQFLKVADKLTVEQGELITYTLHYTNTGELPLKYVWLWDAYDPALVAANSYAPPAKSPETINGRAVWYIGDVPAGASGSVMFDVLVDGNGLDIPDATPIVNHGYFGVTPGELPAEPALTRTVTTTVNAPAFDFTKTDGKTSIIAGESGTYTISLTNNGHTAAQNATLVDTLPGKVTPGTATPPADSANGQVLTWNLGTILPGGTRTITIPYTVAITTTNGTVLTNQATFDYSNPAGHNYTQMSRSDTTTVSNAVMAITKTDTPDPVLANYNLLYTLTYQNTGPAPATNVVIRDTLPISTTFFACSGGCTLVNGEYTWDIGTVAANSSGSVTFTVTVDDVPKDTIITNGDYSLTSDQSGTVTGPAATTVTQRDAAIFDVHAYHDSNGNGLYDAGTDSVLAGVAMTITQAVTPTILTNPNGLARFRVETSGLVTIEADEPAGYIHATPSHLITEAVLGTTTDVYFGYISTTEAFAIIFGTVYDDANHNGNYDPGEVGIAGATVESPQAAAPGSVVTGPYGWYTLRFDTPGTAVITETNAAGYVSTTPDTLTSVPIIIPSNNSSPYDFGDFAGVKITGKVFDDLNANGLNDGEDGLAGVAVSAGLESTQTDANGLYTLYVTVPPNDPITFSETDLPNYTSTNAIPGTGAAKVNNNTLLIAAPVAGTTYDGNEFGDVALADVVTIQGFVWNDNGAGGGITANGLREAGEPGLAGATLSLVGGLSTTSAADGSFTLYGPANTSLTLIETNPGGYESTNAIPGTSATKVDNDTLTIAALPAGSDTTGHLFGDVQPTNLAVVSGFVYDDANENGLKDGETGLPGIPVILEFQDGHSIVIPTAADGSYAFVVNPGENLQISTAGPGGSFYPTSPTSYFFSVPGAGTYPDVNFGFSDDQNAAVITGVVFDDMNSNGERDFGEPGLGGAQVTLDGITNFLTTDTGITAGAYIFTITSAAGLHRVEETIHPAGYRSTTVDSVNVFVVPGNSYFVDFGDTNSPEHASIYGVVFDDFDQDGLRDIGEPGLAGVAITVTTGTGDISMLTKAYGQFSYGFEVQDEGYHTVSSQDPAKPNYHSTTPDSVNLFVAMNQSYQIDFGDALNGNTAMILGTVFQDDNGDGNQDPSELGLSGVTVNLTGGRTAITNGYGWYSFLISSQGLYQVTEVDKPGYYSTTPNQVSVDVNSWTNYQVNFGDLNNPNVTVFFGTVFNDLNVNGAREANELGLPGVTVTLENGLTVPYVTNTWGQYSFLIDEQGTYTITEQDLPGYVSTNAIPGGPGVLKVDANTLTTVVALTDFGQALPDNLFGDALEGSVVTISGMVWEDLNGDGIKDAGEPGLAGAAVSLSTGLSQMTAAGGLYSIYAPAGTALQITEDDPTGYFSTNAIPGTNASKLTNNSIQVNAIAAGGASTGNDFGDTFLAEAGIITGYVFNDVNGNGLLDAGELGIAGVTLTLNGSTTTSSASDGYYQFVVVTPGVYTLVETDPDGYFSVTPNTVHVDVVIGNSYEVNFADAVKQDATFAIVNGTVFNDLNADGQYGADETGIAGVTVTLDGTAATATTSAFGSYFFKVETTGLHMVEQTNLPDYLSTTPDLLGVDVAAFGETYQADFGDVLKGSANDFAVIYGTVFNDLNGNGLRDANESGMPGVTVTLDGTTPAVTNIFGVYTFKVTTAGVHTVVETQPAGFFSTTPDTIHVNAAFANTYRVDFGDAANSSGFGVIYGIVFDDLDFDAVWDANEPGLSGATIELDGGAAATTSNAYGVFFFGVTAGPHQVAETDPAGYQSTTPNLVNLTVNAGEGKLVLFGDFVPCTIVKDSHEEDDTLATAKPIEGFDTAYVYNFNDDASDWFTIQALPRATYTVTVNATGQRSDSVITVYATDQTTVLATNDDMEDFTGYADFSSQVVFVAPARGTYYIHVTNRNDLQGCRTDYELTVEETPDPTHYLYLPLIMKDYNPQAGVLTTAPTGGFSLPEAPAVAVDALSPNTPESPEGVIQHMCEDAYELDDTWELAREIQSGETQLHSFDSNTALFAADKDHVWLAASLLDQVSFTITPVANTLTEIELYDADRNLIKTGTTSLSWTVNKDGNYYLIISPTNDAFGCADVAGYSLEMTRTPARILFLPLVAK